MSALWLPDIAQSDPDAPAIQALLVEVRQLRLTLERSALLAPKLQLTMQRIQLQDQRVARLSEQLSSEADLSRRKQLEEQRSRLKMQAGEVIDQRLLVRESEIAGSLRNERAALEELTGPMQPARNRANISRLR